MLETKLAIELKEIIGRKFSGTRVYQKFFERLEQGGLTRDENPRSHFCVYFSAYDFRTKQVFIGHHKKSDLWLFNGGHIDEGETMGEALLREIGEEWGLDGNDFDIRTPALLTITEINNPEKQLCNLHYDLWCFIPVEKNSFKPVESKLLEEFHEAGWKSTEEARKLIVDKNTLLAIDFIQDNYFLK